MDGLCIEKVLGNGHDISSCFYQLGAYPEDVWSGVLVHKGASIGIESGQKKGRDFAGKDGFELFKEVVQDLRRGSAVGLHEVDVAKHQIGFVMVNIDVPTCPLEEFWVLFIKSA